MSPGPVDPFQLFAYAVAGIFLLAGVLIVLKILWAIGTFIHWIFKKRPKAQVVERRDGADAASDT
jgi:hypothetical protein